MLMIYLSHHTISIPLFLLADMHQLSWPLSKPQKLKNYCNLPPNKKPRFHQMHFHRNTIQSILMMLSSYLYLWTLRIIYNVQSLERYLPLPMHLSFSQSSASASSPTHGNPLSDASGESQFLRRVLLHSPPEMVQSPKELHWDQPPSFSFGSAILEIMENVMFFK